MASANSTNGFFANWEDSGRLQQSYAREPGSFAINDYVKYMQIKRVKGYYLKFTPDTPSRVTDLDNDAWASDSPRPQMTPPDDFRFVPFESTRRITRDRVGKRTIDMTEHDVKTRKRKNCAHNHMTRRTLRVVRAATTTAPWLKTNDDCLSVDHTDTATNLVGGVLQGGSDTDPRILNFINIAMERILLDTNGMLENGGGEEDGKDAPTFNLVMNPRTARLLATSPEYRTYLKNNNISYDFIQGKAHRNNKFSLPPVLYNQNLVLETTTRTTSNPKAAAVRNFAWPDGVIMLATRVGKVEGEEGADLSTVISPYYEDFTIREKMDEDERLYECEVISDMTHLVACANSGFLLTGATA